MVLAWIDLMIEEGGVDLLELDVTELLPWTSHGYVHYFKNQMHTAHKLYAITTELLLLLIAANMNLTYLYLPFDLEYFHRHLRKLLLR